MRRYRDAFARHGKRADNPPFSLNVGGFLHPDGRDAAWAALAEAYMLDPPGVRRLVRPRSGRVRVVVSRPADARAGRERQSEILLGTPDDIVPVLARVARVVGDNLHVMFRSKYPLVVDATVKQSIELLGEVRSRLVG